MSDITLLGLLLTAQAFLVCGLNLVVVGVRRRMTRLEKRVDKTEERLR